MIGNRIIHAVIDTNVLVSSLFSSKDTSNPAQVIKAVICGVITPLYNEEIIEEYREVLHRAKFNFDSSLIQNLIDVFTKYGINVSRTNVVDESFPDLDDIVFYEVAMSVDDAYLVTGNIKHFPSKPFVVTPAQMVEIIRNIRR
ncbi:MAG: putative toxin-antitoxin system toxin component, PIN family [Muribaculaceae bacterium]|nr:putative toxin-antitoxin system toxin component, PIN family [Bacteroidales bacterium]MDE6071420.1 putative toxin-antitoxin system toxin component, PIN family [Muribaculaceae bacterium]